MVWVEWCRWVVVVVVALEPNRVQQFRIDPALGRLPPGVEVERIATWWRVSGIGAWVLELVSGTGAWAVVVWPRTLAAWFVAEVALVQLPLDPPLGMPLAEVEVERTGTWQQASGIVASVLERAFGTVAWVGERTCVVVVAVAEQWSPRTDPRLGQHIVVVERVSGIWQRAYSGTCSVVAVAVGQRTAVVVVVALEPLPRIAPLERRQAVLVVVAAGAWDGIELEPWVLDRTAVAVVGQLACSSSVSAIGQQLEPGLQHRHPVVVVVAELVV